VFQDKQAAEDYVPSGLRRRLFLESKDVEEEKKNVPVYDHEGTRGEWRHSATKSQP